ncbi:unnamed protein product [Peronospora farinosa]|uniref:Dihydrolipoamide acetyltransferase component of pyruvate dehydrogenase complex n=1 Tax=Peronospora farinosa TaxID=134698 RepID=A0ABN8CC12_9STRA|nr:unnamed protein product [Peronospora farinosa]
MSILRVLKRGTRSRHLVACRTAVNVSRNVHSQGVLLAVQRQMRVLSIVPLQPKRFVDYLLQLVLSLTLNDCNVLCCSCFRLQTLMMTRTFSSATAESVPVPSMGDSISEGTVVEWLKAPGDFVETDEVVVVLETDKARRFFSVMKQAASSAPVATTSATAAEIAPIEEAVPGGEDLETVNVPSMGDSISEGTIVTILKNVGDYVRADEAVLIVETDKVSVDVNAPFSGKVTSILAKLDDVVKVGSPLFVIDKAAHAPAESATLASSPAVSAASAVPAVPAQKAPAPPPQASTPIPAAFAAPATGHFNRNETRVQMSMLKVRASQRLKDTQNSAAMLSTFQECDLGNLIALREELGDSFEKTHGVKIGIMSSFLKASAQALQRVPAANSFIDMDAKEVVYNDFVDINVAVASERGVVMPVIRNVEKMSVVDIEKTLAALGEQARDGTLALEDLAGGTFTISNSGVNGALLSTSMLASPQSAVLSVHSVKMRPTVHEGKIVPRPMMFLSLTYDHRIIDGREGVTLLKTIAEAISDPRRLLLNI